MMKIIKPRKNNFKKRILIFVVFIFFFSGIIAFSSVVLAREKINKHYEIKLIYNSQDKKLKLDGYNTVVVPGSATLNNNQQLFLAKLYSFDNKKLTQNYFILNEDNKVVLQLPYYLRGKIVKIFNKDGDDILDINVQVFAQVCGDGKCQDHESYESCSKDCPSGGADDFCDKVTDKICDPDCNNIKDYDSDCTGINPATIYAQLRKKAQEKEKQENKEKNKINNNKKIITTNFSFINNKIIFYTIVIVIIIILLFILFFLKKNKE